MTSVSQALAAQRFQPASAPSAVNARAYRAAWRPSLGAFYVEPAGASRTSSDQGGGMITDKIVKGAGSHRILMALRERPRTSKELKRLVGAINSVSRFDGEYMDRLLANGYVILDGEFWDITVKGRQKCEALGDPEKVVRAGSRTKEFSAAVIERPPVLRPGSLDFQERPSRRGDYLYYRDGRVEKAK